MNRASLSDRENVSPLSCSYSAHKTVFFQSNYYVATSSKIFNTTDSGFKLGGILAISYSLAMLEPEIQLNP